MSLPAAHWLETVMAPLEHWLMRHVSVVYMQDEPRQYPVDLKVRRPMCAALSCKRTRKDG